MQIISSESRDSPLIMFVKDAEKSLVGNSDCFSTFKARIEKLPDNVIVIGSHTQADNRKEKVTSFLRYSIFQKMIKKACYFHIQNLNWRV